MIDTVYQSLVVLWALACALCFYELRLLVQRPRRQLSREDIAKRVLAFTLFAVLAVLTVRVGIYWG